MLRLPGGRYYQPHDDTTGAGAAGDRAVHDALGQSAADSSGIRRAALDYIEGWYEGNGGRMERAVHPELAKRIVRSNEQGRSQLGQMGAMTLVQSTRDGGGKDTPAGERKKDVTIFDIYQHAASAKIYASGWGGLPAPREVERPLGDRQRAVGAAPEEGTVIVRRVAFAIVLAGIHPVASGAQTPDLQGLWSAVLRFGPDIRGTLIVHRLADGWRADIAGFAVPARFERDAVTFELPDGKGSFRGRRSGQRILGQWIQPPTEQSGLGYATPVMLEPDGPSRWRGTVSPLQSRFTFYLPVRRQPDGTLQTYLRNPERNLGWFVRVSRIDVAGADVRLIGRPGSRDTTLVEGRYEEGVISVPLQGGIYEFTRVEDESTSAFYPRKRGDRYRYAPPLRLDDGWPVAPVEDVGMSRADIERFVQMLIDLPMDSLGTSQVHSLLIARHGKLVVEEYFHGYHRDQAHDTRSASKSWVAALIGAAMQAGVPIKLETPVYQTMLGSVPADLDPRKRAMTLEHLISMTAGYRCDDSDPPGTADEDVMQAQEQEPDWYRYTLNVPLESAPGEKLFYCSAEPNLAAGMLEKIAREPLPELFDRLIARPLSMRTYHLLLQPTGEAYGGGGHHFMPRDFMKLAQLMVNDGRWGGRQILSPDWARKSTSPLRDLSALQQQYGWLWNSAEYPYNGRKVRAFFAGGNGGQIFMGIPELDLVIAFTGGSYNQESLLIPQRVYVPQYILPAVN